MTVDDEAVENNEEIEDNDQQKKKKIRKFHPKEFRQRLMTKDAYNGIKEFVQLCTEENSTQDYALEYLEIGGSCSEIIRVIEISENKNASYVLPVMQALSIVLLKIISSHPQKQRSGEESCRDLLSKHFSIIKSMLSLSSNTKQRKVAFRLLSAMVTLSPSLAKDVLAQSYFDQAVLQVLTSPSNSADGNSVRTNFIHFLISFLIEGHIPTILTLLQKRGVLQSIFPGLIYDTPDIIHLVLSTIQSKILTESQISKTLKMSVFSSKDISHFVNLYKWKGPSNWNKKNVSTNNINQEEKQKVCDFVHEFLLILCASKHGIIFYDPMIGLGKPRNPVLCQVLKNLNKPWMNSFAADLTIKICTFCPDLVKEIFSEIDSSLEPRDSINWLNAVRFVRTFIESLEPSCVERDLKDLSFKQIFTIIQTFCVPFCVSKVVSPESVLHEHLGIRHESILLLLTILNSVEKYFETVKKIPISADNKKTTIKITTDHLQKCLPTVSVLLQSFEPVTEIVESNIPIPEKTEHISKLLDVLYKYKKMCPKLVENITKQIDVLQFLKTNKETCNQETNEIQIKTIELFVSCDPFLFVPSSDLFSYVFPLLLKVYYESNENLQIKIRNILVNLLKVTKIFEQSTAEMCIWLYSVLEMNNYDDNFGIFFTSVIKDTNENYLSYIGELKLLQESTINESDKEVNNFENLLKLDNNENFDNVQMKLNLLSPLIIGFLKCILKSENFQFAHYLKNIFLHLLFSQTDPKQLCSVISKEKYKSICDKNILKYCKSLDDNILKKIFKSDNKFVELYNFINNEEKELTLISSKYKWRHYYDILFTNFTIYFYTRFVSQQKLTDIIQQNCLQIFCHIINTSDDNLRNCLDSILRHPVLLETFSSTYNNIKTNEGLCTNFVVQIIEEALKKLTKEDLDTYLIDYRSVLFSQICNMLKNDQNNSIIVPKLMEIVKLIDFNYEQIVEILRIIAHSKLNAKDDKILILSDIFNYAINHNLILNLLNPIPDDIMKKIGTKFQQLFSLRHEICVKFEDSLYNYIKQFPHTVTYFSRRFVDSLLMRPLITKSTIKLATILMRSNQEYTRHFETRVKNILEKRELVLALLNVLLEMRDEKIIFVDKIATTVYKEYEPIILKFLNKPQKISNYLIEYYSVVIKLINSKMSIENCNNFCSKIQKFDVVESYHFEAVSNVFAKSIINETDENKKIVFVTNYISTAMNLLNNGLKRLEKIENECTKMEKISTDFLAFIIKIKNVYKINYTDENLYKTTVFQNFSKLCLKYGLKDKPILIKILKQICDLTETENEDFEILFDMAMMHSESLNILLSNNDIKPPLLSLLLVLCKKCPTVMKKNHIPIWLGAYSATLSQNDQYLLQLLIMYEEANIGFHEFRPFLWGTVAVGHYSIQSGISTNIWRQPKPKDVLEIFDENKINNTVINYPRRRGLRPSDALYSDDNLNVYDPSFYLPLLSHLLAPESTIRWYQISNRGILNLPIISLTSYSKEVRLAAWHVLSRFHSHVEAATYAKQRIIWQHFVEMICRGTHSSKRQRLSPLVAVFLCRCSTIFTTPDHRLYKSLGNYLTAKETPNFDLVPELLNMLHSDDVLYKEKRVFILKVMRDGLCAHSDLKVMSCNVAFKYIMDMFNSVVSNQECRQLILEILAAAAKLHSAFLIYCNSLFPWLFAVLKQFTKFDSKQLCILIDIIHNLFHHTAEAYFKPVQFKVLFLLATIIEVMKNIPVDSITLIKFVKLLYFVYEKKPNILSKQQISDLIDICSQFLDCNICYYYLKFGSTFIEKPILNSDDDINQGIYYLKLLTLKYLDAAEIVSRHLENK